MTKLEKQPVLEEAKATPALAPGPAPAAASTVPPPVEPPGPFDDFLLGSQLAPTLPALRPKLPRTRSKSGDSSLTAKDHFLEAASPPTQRRSSFQAFTVRPLINPTQQGGTSASDTRMMTTMNMASRLAGSRVKDQTLHHSLSDRSSTHAKPAPAQDSNSRSGGFSADGMKRISHGFDDSKVAPCVSTPICHPPPPYPLALDEVSLPAASTFITPLSRE
jgi:hypothetical protein